MRLDARILAAFAIFAIVTVSAHASTVVYTSQTAFDGAATNLTTYDFPDAPQYVQTYQLGPLAFSSEAGVDLYNDGYYGNGQTYLGTDYSNSESIAVNGVTEVGLNLGTFYGAETLTIDVNGNLVATLPTAGSPDFSFFGVTSTTPITSIDITSTNTYGNPGPEEIDVLNAQVGPVSPVPEPSTFVLLGTGLLGAAGAMRRRFLALAPDRPL